MNQQDDIARLRAEYKAREHRFSGKNVYSWSNPAYRFAIQGRQRAELQILKKYGYNNFSNLKIFEMGCGGGGVMTEYLGYGALPGKLFGVDLLPDRLQKAFHRLPDSNFANGDGQTLPFQSRSFDLVLQYTAISSILDPVLRRDICADMLRVLKPGGLIFSYDFWLNPTNKQTRGLRLSEIRTSFPDCQVDYKKITLAPPIARRLVPISWLLSAFLEKLTVFNMHYFVAIRPNYDS